MKIFRESSALNDFSKQLRLKGKRIGFVPTMGSLHEGHLSLIDLAKANCDLVIASIFVNPTQFNDPEDFEKYPQDLERDKDLLVQRGCDVLFFPQVSDIYPGGLEKGHYNIGALAEVLEGRFRPGHFDGVIEVVKRLFDIVQPDAAFFGQKDYQQLAVIHWMRKHFDLPIDIIGGPIIRDHDGLALSSRNVRLSEDERKSALKLSKALFFIKENYRDKKWTDMQKELTEDLNADPHLEVEYLELADARDLHPISDLAEASSAAVFLAAFCGEVRLIDNIVLF